MKRKTKVILIIVICAVIAGAMLFTAGFVSGWETDSRGPSHNTNFNNELNPLGQYSVPASGINSIEIEWVGGKVSVESYDGSEILLEESSSEKIDENNYLGFKVSEGTLEIIHHNNFLDVDLPRECNNHDKNLTIKIPQTLASGLNEFDFESKDADLDITDVTASSFSAETRNGSVTASDVNFHEIEMDTKNGNLNVTNLITPSEIEISSEKGNAELILPSDSQFTATMESASGTITSDFPGTCSYNYCTVGNGTNSYEMASRSGSLHFIPHDKAVQ